jgi:hypothetical protein
MLRVPESDTVVDGEIPLRRCMRSKHNRIWVVKLSSAILVTLDGGGGAGGAPPRRSRRAMQRLLAPLREYLRLGRSAEGSRWIGRQVRSFCMLLPKKTRPWPILNADTGKTAPARPPLAGKRSPAGLVALPLLPQPRILVQNVPPHPLCLTH